MIYSKYCKRTGRVIARMDHYCIFINNSIGFKNHKIFVVFLISHVLTLGLIIAVMMRFINFIYATSCNYVNCSISVLKLCLSLQN